MDKQRLKMGIEENSLSDPASVHWGCAVHDGIVMTTEPNANTDSTNSLKYSEQVLKGQISRKLRIY